MKNRLYLYGQEHEIYSHHLESVIKPTCELDNDIDEMVNANGQVIIPDIK